MLDGYFMGLWTSQVIILQRFWLFFNGNHDRCLVWNGDSHKICLQIDAIYRERIRQLESDRLLWPIKKLCRDLREGSWSAWIWLVVAFLISTFHQARLWQTRLESNTPPTKHGNFKLTGLTLKSVLYLSFLEIIMPLAFYEVIEKLEYYYSFGARNLRIQLFLNQSSNQSSAL